LKRVFLKPFEGAKKDGVKGFFKGTLQGLSGLVIKPVTGILDAAAKTTEGIKNTVQYWDDKPNENRERNIRPIYGPEG
jgi:vacuolar protein sorting-associated protein 13A/C